MNSTNSDALATATATGHRDPKSLQGYIVPSDALKMKAARTIGSAMKSSSVSSSISARASSSSSSVINKKRKIEYSDNEGCDENEEENEEEEDADED
jgi:hypothetical protein